MKALLGKKIGMSQVFSKNGEVTAVTLISAQPNIVTLRRTEAKDGYSAVQLGLPREKSKSKEQKSNNLKMTPRQLKREYVARSEFKGAIGSDTVTVGVDQFQEGDVVKVIGISKGKGFAGVVKRHHFKGGPASHGHRHVLRRPGSIGSRFPQHVFKGTRMAGRMGSGRVTVKNLVVMAVDPKRNVLAVKGAIPGAKGSVVEIQAVENTQDNT